MIFFRIPEGLWPLIFWKIKARGFDHKSTYVMQPCIAAAYIYHTMGGSHNMWTRDLLGAGFLFLFSDETSAKTIDLHTRSNTRKKK